MRSFYRGDLAEVPYYYIDRQSEAEPDEPGEVVETEEGYRWKLITEQREGYSRPRRTVIDRIEMLGYTEAYSRREFAYLARRNGFDQTLFTYDELAAVLRAVDVTGLSFDHGEGGEDFGKFFRREIFPRLPFEGLAAHPDHIRYDAAQGMENISADTVVRLLGENPSARDLPLIWDLPT